MTGGAKMTSSSLAAITSLKKLVNHPDLVFPACRCFAVGSGGGISNYPMCS